MRILVYPAGVQGSLYGARLKEAGQDVAILARGKRLAELRARGVILVDLHFSCQRFAKLFLLWHPAGRRISNR
jgi:2-dehydropantoate 2-reductase